MTEDASSGMSGAMSDASSSVSDALSGNASSSDDASQNTSDNTSANPSSAAAPAAASANLGWATRLVNAANPLPDDFSVKTVLIQGYENRPFDARAADALEAMLADAEAAGCKLYLVSAYRSVERQTALFARKTNYFLQEGFPQDEAEKQAAQWVARPGTSEHNLGLAVDLVSADWYQTHNDLTADFDQTSAFAWLQAHCAEYGFVLRYPKGKETITGVTYEPWHYRYVGQQAAQELTAQGLTLEEYTERTV
jgi:D-alanyl-D-alanine carboxypeptidase